MAEFEEALWEEVQGDGAADPVRQVGALGWSVGREGGRRAGQGSRGEGPCPQIFIGFNGAAAFTAAGAACGGELAALASCL